VTLTDAQAERLRDRLRHIQVLAAAAVRAAEEATELLETAMHEADERKARVWPMVEPMVER
jgi:hypothetical protein